MFPRRFGASLLEVLIVVAILGLLIGLLLPAVQRVRRSALGMKEKNQFRQIVLALHSLAAENGDSVPSANPGPAAMAADELYIRMLPYLEVQQPYYYLTAREGIIWQHVKVFTLESDATLQLDPDILRRSAPVSIVANGTAFEYKASLSATFQDGTSNTIAFGEHYHYTLRRQNSMVYGGSGVVYPGEEDWKYATYRLPNFADRQWQDVVPITSGQPPTTRPSTPGVKFQVLPELFSSDGRQLQAMQPEGLKVAMADGSVRTISPNVSEGAFWAAVTPAGGETVGID